MKKEQALMVAGINPATSQNPLGIGELDPRSISQMPLAQYYSLAGSFVNVQNAVYYDIAYYAAGTAITPQHIAKLFTKGKTQNTNVVNTGTAIAVKGEFMTNMISDGEFEGGTTFMLEQIACDFLLTSEPATTYGDRGEIENPVHAASATYSLANHYAAVSRQFELVYMRNEEPKLRGLLCEFPSPFVASGSIGNSLGGFIQNGYANTWNKLSRVPVLQSEDKFSLELRPLADTFTPTVPLVLRVALIGKAIKTFIP